MQNAATTTGCRPSGARATLAVLGLTLALAPVRPVAAQGVTDDRIVLGQVCALRGPAAGLGHGMQAGLHACFDRVNAAGGVHGRRIELLSRNDGYEPERCVVATRELIDQASVFAIIGGVGTPTAQVALPLCTAAQVPFLGALTGAELLRTPYNPYAVNVRASYYQETEALVGHLVERERRQRIACFYQSDAYGEAGLAGVERALASRSLQLAASGSYKRNTLAIAAGLRAIAESHPDAVVLIGAYAPCAEFMKQAKVTPGLAKATLCDISFVGTDNLIAAAGDAGEGSIVSQVVPLPTDERVPIVREYLADMAATGRRDDVGFVSLEGYVVARFFVAAAQRAGRNLTREGLLASVAAMRGVDLGGIALTFGPGDNQGSDAVYLTKIVGGKVVAIEPADFAAPAK